MKKIFIFSAAIIFNFIFYNMGFTVMANPDIIKEKQPDGTEIDVKLLGDEFYSWYEDNDGYTVIKDTQTKIWSYAKKNKFGDLEPSHNIVGKIKPLHLGITKSLHDENKFIKAKQKRADYNNNLQKTVSVLKSNKNDTLKSSGDVQRASYSNSLPEKKTNFVLLVEFSDLRFTDNPPFKSSSKEQIVQAFKDLFNKNGYNKDGAAGSVKDYFKEISYNNLDYESVVSEIVTLDDSYKNFSWSKGESTAINNVQLMIRKTLQKLDEKINFKEYWPNSNTPEGFTVIHAGGGAESGNREFIWSHKSKITPITLDGITFEDYHIEPAGRGRNGNEGLVRIGVICHESLHFFGLPDLYDTTYATSGLGKFCIMASGEWNGSQGSMPAHPCAWAKYKLGWINCKKAEEGINYIGESATDDDAFYLFKPASFNPSEYFLMENRQSVGFDKSLPGNKRGLLIYHVDETQDGNNLVYNRNYQVALEEAGSGTSSWRKFPLIKNSSFGGSDSDYFRSNTISYFNDECVSSPNSKNYGGISSGIKISGISQSSSLMSFMYGKDVEIICDLSGIVCYPNPARNGMITIARLPTDMQDFSAEIFTLTSKLVRSFCSDDTEFTTDGLRRLKWDCKNDSGEDVAPGVYLVLIKNNLKKRVLKVAVIR